LFGGIILVGRLPGKRKGKDAHSLTGIEVVQCCGPRPHDLQSLHADYGDGGRDFRGRKAAIWQPEPASVPLAVRSCTNAPLTDQ
jgi:hypothetical protein